MTSRMTMKYMNPIRDIPEHEGWIGTKIAEGNIVMMVGKDAIALRQRITDPERYSKQNPKKPMLSIWLMVTSRDPRADKVAMWSSDLMMPTAMCICCDQVHPDPVRGCPTAVRFKFPRGALRGCRYGRGITEWYRSVLMNANSIEVYFFVASRFRDVYNYTISDSGDLNAYVTLPDAEHRGEPWYHGRELIGVSKTAGSRAKAWCTFISLTSPGLLMGYVSVNQPTDEIRNNCDLLEDVWRPEIAYQHTDKLLFKIGIRGMDWESRTCHPSLWFVMPRDPNEQN
ncbi:MAG: hypothetical protein L6R38_000543 [Xanthoria sp. 2 TBL-2021]|nr:MAG: hypothetical protein L6R38_000543 [Xanthoria sp. 2 TBL-2021]